MNRFSIRLDDITPDMDWEKFYRVKGILDKFDIKPLIGIVPDNQDKGLSKQEPKAEFWQEMRELVKNGWSIAQHGYGHRYESKDGGLLGINMYSEFAGLSFDKQKEKLSKGKQILEENGIITDIFMAPAHSYDENTLKALAGLGFRYVTDGYTKKPYRYKGLMFLPCRTANYGKVEGIDTFCIHANTIEEKDLLSLERFLEGNKQMAVSFSEFLKMDFGPELSEIPKAEKKNLRRKYFKQNYFGSSYIQNYMNRTNASNSVVKLLKRLLFSPMLVIGMIKVWKKS